MTPHTQIITKRRGNNPDGRKPANLCGGKFNMLTVLSFHHRARGGYHWNTVCQCGGTKVVKTADLRSGNVQSCGCLKRYVPSRILHGRSRIGSRTYKSWMGMMARCYQPNTTRYEDWGGRGITVCDRWHDFVHFLADMGDCPPRLTIDRIDNEGNYEPGNCQWADYHQQRINQRPRRAKHARICAMCGTEFMAIMPWAKFCKKACKQQNDVEILRMKAGKS